MAVRHVAHVISRDMDISDAIKFVVCKSPGATTGGILARLRSYGWTGKDEHLSGYKIGRLLQQMGDRGLIKIERRKSGSRFWPAEIQAQEAGAGGF
ncbi:MAG: hypothetical protein ACYCT2_04380 [Thermoplasmataceae archaeon]